MTSMAMTRARIGAAPTVIAQRCAARRPRCTSLTWHVRLHETRRPPRPLHGRCNRATAAHLARRSSTAVRSCAPRPPRPSVTSASLRPSTVGCRTARRRRLRSLIRQWRRPCFLSRRAPRRSRRARRCACHTWHAARPTWHLPAHPARVSREKLILARAARLVGDAARAQRGAGAVAQMRVRRFRR